MFHIDTFGKQLVKAATIDLQESFLEVSKKIMVVVHISAGLKHGIVGLDSAWSQPCINWVTLIMSVAML